MKHLLHYTPPLCMNIVSVHENQTYSIDYKLFKMIYL